MLQISKSLTKAIFSLAAGTVLFSSCATIVGGGKYYAHVNIKNHPNAVISYNGEVLGQGYAAFKVPRREANSFSITLKEENCEEQHFDFKERSFRGWAFVGTLITWTGLSINGGPWLPIPFGVIVDGATGAFWKPDINEKGVTKTDYKNYNYLIDYTGCKQSSTDKENNKPLIYDRPVKGQQFLFLLNHLL